MELSIVIVNYNTREFLRACLASLQACTLEHEVIVVDNASRDGSVEMVQSTFPSVRLLAQAVNTWFCGGNNLGIQAARGEYVLLLNPDTVVEAGALEQLVAFLRHHPNYAGATAQLIYPNGQTQQTCSRLIPFRYLLYTLTPWGMMRPGARQQLQQHIWYQDEGFDRTTDRDVETLPGSCLLMRRGDIQLDGDLLLYFPEDMLAWQHAHRPFRFVAGARIQHFEKSSTRNWNASRIFFRDALIFTHKRFGYGARLMLWGLTRPLWLAMWARHHLFLQTRL